MTTTGQVAWRTHTALTEPNTARRSSEGVEVVGGGERARCHRRCAEAQQVGHDDGGVPAERVEAGTEAVTRGGHTV